MIHHLTRVEQECRPRLRPGEAVDVAAAVGRRLRQADNARMEYLRLLVGAICADDAEVEAPSLLA